MRKWFSRKWLLVLLWFGLLTYCCIRDGEFVQTGFVKILSIIGGIVTSAFVLGNYLLQIQEIKLTHGSTSVEISTRKKEQKNGSKKQKRN